MCFALQSEQSCACYPAGDFWAPQACDLCELAACRDPPLEVLQDEQRPCPNAVLMPDCKHPMFAVALLWHDAHYPGCGMLLTRLWWLCYRRSALSHDLYLQHAMRIQADFLRKGTVLAAYSIAISPHLHWCLL